MFVQKSTALVKTQSLVLFEQKSLYQKEEYVPNQSKAIRDGPFPLATQVEYSID